MFGISKNHYREQTYLGEMKYDWSIDLTSGKKWSDSKYNFYCENGKIGDKYTC